MVITETRVYALPSLYIYTLQCSGILAALGDRVGSLAIMALVIIATAISEHSITSPVMNVIN